MARRNRDDVCLICTSIPCTCGKVQPVKKQGPIRAAPVAAVKATPSVMPESPVGHPRRVGLSGIRTGTGESVRSTAILREADGVDPDPDPDPDDGMAEAVTILVRAGLVSEDSMNEHRHLIKLSDAEIRAILWKRRRGVTDGNVQQSSTR